MARLYEHQGKGLLAEHGVPVPRGRLAASPEEAAAVAGELATPVVLKSQVWSTHRAAHGGIRFAETPDEARQLAAEMLGQTIQGVRVETVLVEEKLDIADEWFASVLIDGEQRRPRVFLSSTGGTGIEEIAAEHPGSVATRLVDLGEGLQAYQARELARAAGVPSKHRVRLGAVLVRIYELAKSCEARSLEVNPLVLTAGGTIVAADCRIAIDDYAVFRHPELGIDVAREFSRPPTPLDRIAYEVERGDYRGTFFFMQLAEGFERGDGVVGFHGAGGGGSMMAMDALGQHDLTLANFTDTSGNPPASKMYRAAKIILSQPGLDGYFASGSGVASQEQTNGARGIAKAFREERLSIPAVVRLGGNREDRAVELLHAYTADLPAPVEGYKKDDPAVACAARLAELIETAAPARRGEPVPTAPARRPAEAPYAFDTQTGSIVYDHAQCLACLSKVCVSACEPQILALDGDVPVLAISREAARTGGCTECLACELECAVRGNGGAEISLPIDGLEAYHAQTLEVLS